HNCQINICQGDDVKIIANEFLGKLLGFDHCFGHDFCSFLNQPQRSPQVTEKKREDRLRRLLTLHDLCVLCGLCGYCFGRTLCPSFKSAGGLTIKSSPPISPFETTEPWDDAPAN